MPKNSPKRPLLADQPPGARLLADDRPSLCRSVRPALSDHVVAAGVTVDCHVRRAPRPVRHAELL